mmetsp:Transcript_47158/g.151334  ORF Transcript_47158/g.151334 Transcript_47158/m.151334 type:complete len:161 (+) Transcript_47158:1069-1551(+)
MRAVQCSASTFGRLGDLCQGSAAAVACPQGRSRELWRHSGGGCEAIYTRGGKPPEGIRLLGRAPSHFAVAHLAIAENWPLPEMLRTTPEEVRLRAEKVCFGLARGGNEQPTVVCVCRRGVDSFRAARRLREAGIQAVSLAGGLQAFARESEPDLEAPRLT